MHVDKSYLEKTKETQKPAEEVVEKTASAPVVVPTAEETEPAVEPKHQAAPKPKPAKPVSKPKPVFKPEPEPEPEPEPQPVVEPEPEPDIAPELDIETGIEPEEEPSLLTRILNEDTGTHELLKDIITDEEPVDKPFELTAPVLSLDRGFKAKMTSTIPFVQVDQAQPDETDIPEEDPDQDLSILVDDVLDDVIDDDDDNVETIEAESAPSAEQAQEQVQDAPVLKMKPASQVKSFAAAEAATETEPTTEAETEPVTESSEPAASTPKIVLDKPKAKPAQTKPAKKKSAAEPLTTDDKALIAIAVIEIIALIVFAVAHGLGYLTATVGILGLIAGGLLATRGRARTLSKVAGVVFSIIAVVVSLAFIAVGIVSFAPEQTPSEDTAQNQAASDTVPGETPLDQPTEPQAPLFSQVQWLMDADDIGYSTYKGDKTDPMDNHVESSWDATCGYGIAQKTLRVSARSVVEAYGPEEIHVTINIKYPEVTSTSRDMTAVNAKFAEMANNIASVYYAPTADMVAMRNASGGHDIKAEADYVITYNDADIISIVFTGNVSVGNAQMERPYIEAACVSLSNGRIYSFDDILEMTPEMASAWVEDVRDNHQQGRWVVETFGADALADEITKNGEGRISHPMVYVAANRDLRLMAPCALRVSNEVFRSPISCKVTDKMRENAKESSFWESF